MAFAAVTPIASVDGSLLTISGDAVDGALSFQSNISIPSISARPQFGGSDWIKRAAQKSGLSMDGSINGYVSQTIFASLYAKIIAGAAVAITMQDETGAGKDVYSANFILTGLSRTNAAEGYVEFSCSFQSAGDVTKSPSLVMTPASGALTAGQVGVAYTATTVACTGGSASYVYSMEGDNEVFPGSSLNTSTGAVTGTPITGTAGTYRSKIRSTDANGVYVINEYTIVIAA